MTSHEQLRQEIEKIIENAQEHPGEEDDPNRGYDEWWLYPPAVYDGITALIDKAKREAVDEFQDRLDEKEFTLGGDTTTPAIVYQWMQEVTDEMFPKSE